MPKISEITAATAITDDDLLYVINDPLGTIGSRKVTFANVKASLALGDSATLDVGTTAGTVAAGDHLHAGVYESANANIQAHIVSTANPHSVTAEQVLPTQTGNNGKYLTTDGSASSWGTVDALPSQTGNNGKYLTTDGSTPSWATVATASVVSFGLQIGDGSTVITTGIKGDISIPFACTITGVTLLADQVGSIVVDLWKDTYANYPATAGDSITASAKPTISGAVKSVDTTLTGWTTSVSAGDTLRVNVDSITTLTRVTLIISAVR